MSRALALMRANWMIANSYRLRLVISFAGLMAAVVPVYFVSHALQPMMARPIAGEGGQYFGFVLVGLVAFSFLGVAVSAIPGIIRSGIGSGTLEVMLTTPTRIPTLLFGLVSYDLLWTTVRSIVLLAAGVVLGASFAWRQLPAAFFILTLTVVSYLPFGLLAAAAILVFRTSGPLNKAVIGVSTLLGGVYYPTHVIPSWLEDVSRFVPLTYGLRALRRTILEGLPLRAVLGDVGILAAASAVLLAMGVSAFVAAVRYARRSGTLSHY